MRVLILGGNGFLGSHLIDVLEPLGHDIVVLDQYSERFREPRDGITYVSVVFGNRSELEEVLSNNIDVVVHLVSSTLPKSSNEDPSFDVQSNVIESIVLFELCVKHHIKRVVFISSGGTVYGLPESMPVGETHPTNPICSYGITKLAIEKYLHLFKTIHGLDYTVLRLSNPYGPRQDPSRNQGVIGVFMKKIILGEPITLWGDGTILRDFIYVEDFAQICAKSITSNINGVFNVGSGEGTSMRDLIVLLGNAVGIQPIVSSSPGRVFDVPAIVLNNEKAKKAFNWIPEVSLNVGVLKFYDWMAPLVKNGRNGI